MKYESHTKSWFPSPLVYEIFKQRSYEGHDDWELRASGVRFHAGDKSDLMTILQAVELASLLQQSDTEGR
ncbi:MAG TPA: hypothetical protein VEV42_19685 [Pyrinomonadaceae bacterium]|jgi:hypothetical protein|nr:hypothetical protein [Pyrinomonadaceae bacterium]